MVNDVFHSYRNHDTVAREGSEQTSRGGIGDLLAELARLTGQGDPYGDGGRDGGSSRPGRAEDDTSPEQRQQGEDHYVALWRPKSPPVPRERSKQKKPPSTRQFSRPVGEMRAAETDETHGAYSFYDALPSPRWRLVIVIAVLGLAGLGVVSAFAYRAVFEGALLPTFPPLTAAENGPKKIVLNYGDARRSNSSQTSMVSAGSSEKFVSRWPADNQEPPKTAPISPNPSAPRPGVPIAPAAAAPPPAVAPPALTAPSVPPPVPAPVPALHSPEPKKIHTVIIRSDGSEQTDTSAAAVAHSATSARAPGPKPSTAAAP
jgi:hypothetical protein